MKKGIYETALDLIEQGIKRYGTAKALSDASGVSQANISHWMKRKRNPGLNEIGRILDLLNVSFVCPEDINPSITTKEVCFVDAQLVPAGEHIAPPQAEAYLAAPLVGEVGAGPGYLDQEQVLSWFLVYRYALPAGHSNDLIAVQIGDRSTSMQPTLYPGDIVLVDRGDTAISYAGRMMLVRDPDDGSGMIKRVTVKPAKDDQLIIYYSDNASEYEPMIYSLESDFYGDMKNAIVGRVIWAWSDVRNK